MLKELKKKSGRTSLGVQWLRFSTFTTVAQAQSLVQEVRTHVKPLHAMHLKKKKKKKKEKRNLAMVREEASYGRKVDLSWKFRDEQGLESGDSFEKKKMILV